jgi:DEAD/DEAH box helicase
MASNAFSLARAGGSSTLTRVTQVLDTFAARDRDGEILTAVRHYPAREAQWAEFPEWVHAELRAAYYAKGIRQLYTHQAAAAEAVHKGKNVVIVTPTASGKTLCYNLPVLDAILANDDTRAMYLFPTKALAQDQLAELHDLKIVSVCLLMTATRLPTPAKPSARKATSCSQTRICCTPASCRTTPDGRASSKICATSWWTNCTPIAAFSEATSATCCAASSVSRAFMAASRSSSAARPRLQIRASLLHA